MAEHINPDHNILLNDTSILAKKSRGRWTGLTGSNGTTSMPT